MKEWLYYDDTNLGEFRRGKPATARLRSAHLRLERLRETGEQGFFDLPFNRSEAALIERTAGRVRERFRCLIVVGIGGSELGAQAIHQAVGGHAMDVRFLSSPDPDLLHDVCRAARFEKTAIHLVSKSGTTIESMAIFFTLRAELIKAVGKPRYAEHVFVTTDTNGNPLHRFALSEGYTLLPHPVTVGGRFAALSAVGLFAAAASGTPIARILSGARRMEQHRRSFGPTHVSARFAARHERAYTKEGLRIHVLMPYADRLSDMAVWYRQLWAESLGKKKGQGSVGPTPVAACGPADQHSQLQLYQDGPRDKLVTFLEVDNFTTHTKVPPIPKNFHELSYISGRGLSDIMHAERKGTARALARHNRPNETIHLVSISPESIGAFMHFYLCATAYMGELLGVNSFDQPGVEESKLATRKMLS
jgi:glucose-6-phosphate isomerase